MRHFSHLGGASSPRCCRLRNIERAPEATPRVPSVLHWDGSAFRPIEPPPGVTARGWGALTGAGQDDVWVGCRDATGGGILRRPR